ncbi:hypothetical protein PV11_03487 [Exophiala sideris]|uniref:Uncharacterized protein n=1 Tax=Exophiala sideris TaxID=1016849 RepID=A0A0D1X1D3_9EURO|nr:hypothetical protein PV11_03487 [Exophiala sideris]
MSSSREPILQPEISGRDPRGIESSRNYYQPERPHVKFKIVLLGEGEVGKSALIQNALHRPFNDGYNPTIMDSHQVEVSIRGQSYTLEIVDLSSQYNIITNFESDIYHAADIIYVYSIIDVPRKDGEEMAFQIEAVFKEMSAKDGNSMPGVLSALTESMLSEKEKLRNED